MVKANPRELIVLKKPDLLKKLEKGLGFSLEMRDDPLLRPDEFKLVVKGAGRDVTQQYNVSASVTPETPAPPFQIGLPCFANNGAEFVFVQASTSISLGDFVTITNSMQANSLTSVGSA